MKKCLFVVSMFLGVTAFANPWDFKNPQQKKVNWVVPHFQLQVLAPSNYIIITDASVTEESFPWRIKIWIKFNDHTTVKLRIVTMVYGYWASVGDWEPKYFDVPLNIGQDETTYNHNLSTGDIPAVSMYDFQTMEPW